MSALTLEENPPVICSRGYTKSSLPKPTPKQTWYVGCVKSNQERKLADEMRRRGLTYFLPMQPCKINSGRQTIDGMRLIFPSFLFFLVDPDGYHETISLHRTYHVIRTNDQIGLRRDLCRLSKTIKHLMFAPRERMKPGQWVRVIEGHALAGLIAKVDLCHDNIIHLKVDMIGAAPFRIEAKFLEVINHAHA